MTSVEVMPTHPKAQFASNCFVFTDTEEYSREDAVWAAGKQTTSENNVDA